MRRVQPIVLLLLAVVLTGCSAQPTAGADNHDTSSGAAHSDTHTNSGPYDAQFIDGMTLHHQGAVVMAEQALKESQRPEIKQLSQNIIATQTAEIEQMAAWRQQWYPDLAPTGGTGGHMGDMQLSSDSSIPFDQRFITAMISHHAGAIDMAQEAQTKAEHAEVRQLAGAIVQAQEAEIQQLQAWQKTWFGQ